jgi:hypothetical protein
MEKIAAAAPHLRASLLHQLMQERLGVAQKPTEPPSQLNGGGASGSGGRGKPLPVQPPAVTPLSPLSPRTASTPSLSALSRPEQQQIVRELMSQMTPQQRHTMLRLPTVHQADLLQQYYVKYVAPTRLQQRPQHSQPERSYSMVPLSTGAAAAAAATGTTTMPRPTAPGLMQRAQSTPNQNNNRIPLNDSSTVPLPANGASFLRELLSELGESAEAQLSAMPREHQQKVILGLIHRRRQKLLLQQQQQEQQRQQQPLVRPSRQTSLDISNPGIINNPLNQQQSMPALGPILGQNGVPGVDAIGPAGANSGGGSLFAPDVGGLDGLLGSGFEPDNDALEDAMNFLV